MKFASPQDEQLANQLAEKAQKSIGDYISHRRKLVGSMYGTLKDFRKKQNAKHNWRVNKRSMIKGMKRFAKSTKGKAFHRKLGRYISDRSSAYKESHLDTQELLTALLSLRTHLVIESTYFIPDFDENVSSYTFIQEASEIVKEAIYNVEHGIDLTEDQFNILNEILTIEE